MKAIVSTRYGSPDVLELREIATPTPRDNEVLIRVRASVVGPADCAFRKGDPFLIKLIYGLRRPKFAIGGAEFAGEIAAVGKDVVEFKEGDRVFGASPHRFGTYAEYLCLPAAELMIRTPAAMSDAEAVGVVDGGATALTFLRDVAKVQPGQRVLINGASGAVGAYAVQLAKYFGAEVTGVCGGANVELVKSLGADRVIDYTREDFTRTGRQYDVIFDAVGKSTFGRCKRALTPRGVYLTTVPTLATFAALLRTSLFSRKKAKFATAGLMQTNANLTFLKERFEDGSIRAVIDRCYPLEEMAAAHRYVDTGRKKGNVVIRVSDDERRGERLTRAVRLTA